MEAWERGKEIEWVKLTHLDTGLMREDGKVESSVGRTAEGEDGENNHRRNCSINVR